MENLERLKERYLKLYPSDGVDKEVLSKTENILKVSLPRDFCEIASFYSGGYLGGISNHSFSDADGSTNIIEETIRLRNTINLPLKFIVLAEPTESLIVMDTKDTPSIIWCDAVEASRLGSKSFVSKPDEWSSYMEYFSQLLEDEEEEQL